MMENEILDGENSQNSGLTLSAQDKMNFYTASGWVRFLGMTGMIFLGLYMLFALYAMIQVAGMIPSAAAGIFLALLFVSLGFYAYFLFYRFGVRIRQAVSNNDQDALSGGLADFKNYMLIIGIITIIFLAIFLLMFMIIGVGGMAAMLQGGGRLGRY